MTYLSIFNKHIFLLPLIIYDFVVFVVIPGPRYTRGMRGRAFKLHTIVREGLGDVSNIVLNKSESIPSLRAPAFARPRQGMRSGTAGGDMDPQTSLALILPFLLSVIISDTILFCFSVVCCNSIIAVYDWSVGWAKACVLLIINVIKFIFCESGQKHDLKVYTLGCGE